MSDETASPLAPASKAIRDAAKYLVAAFGAIGAVLVSGLSLTALPTGAHPVLAAFGIAVAVLALALLIGLAVSVIAPKSITMGELADCERTGSDSVTISRLKADEGLFAGQGTDLKAFHTKYVQALKDRIDKYEAYVEDPTEDNETAMEVASARAELATQASSQILETALFFQLEERFSPARRVLMTILALVVVASAGLFAWASTASSEPDPMQPPSTQRLWLEHLAATSDFRIERLEQEAERTPTPIAQIRIGKALARQEQVQSRQELAIDRLAVRLDE